MQEQQPPSTTQIIIIGKSKSAGLAFITSFLFRPLSLFYATISGGIIMMFFGLIRFILIPAIGPLLIWLLSTFWAITAAVAANNISKNQQFAYQTGRNNKQYD